MDVALTHILPNYPREMHVQWALLDPDPNLADGVTFTVQRSGSPRGEWKTLTSHLDTVYYKDTFQDRPSAPETYEENLLSLNREVWYRVIATFADGTELISKPMDNEGMVEPELQRVRPVGLHPRDTQTHPNPVTVFSRHPNIDKRLRLISRAVIRRDALALRYFNGIDIGVLKRRHFGQRCTLCTEPITKEVLVSNCANCYGTGWTGGFYPLIVTLGRLMDREPVINTETEGRTNVIRGRLSLINFPRIEKDDILIEMDSNRRWIANGTDDVHWRRRKITQAVTCTELARTSVYYTVDVTDGEQDPIVEPLFEFSSAFASSEFRTLE